MAAHTKAIGQWMAPARFVLFAAAFAAATAGARVLWDWSHAIMTGFDCAAALFLASCYPLLNDTPATIRRTAKENDANRAVLLVLSAAVAGVILVTVGTELAQKSASGPPVLLVVVTLALSWLFTNSVYAMHYAHLFYSQDDQDEPRDAGGIDFPGAKQPDYTDFIYFAFTLGMTFQTSDTDITSRAIRRTAIFHCFAAFIFNIGVLAFTINVLGSG